MKYSMVMNRALDQLKLEEDNDSTEEGNVVTKAKKKTTVDDTTIGR